MKFDEIIQAKKRELDNDLIIQENILDSLNLLSNSMAKVYAKDLFAHDKGLTDEANIDAEYNRLTNDQRERYIIKAKNELKRSNTSHPSRRSSDTGSGTYNAGMSLGSGIRSIVKGANSLIARPNVPLGF